MTSPHLTTRLSLNGNWRFAPANPISLANTETKAWLPAAVPGHVHLDLMAAGVIPDPFQRMYEWTCAWVDEMDWVYERDFALPAADAARWVLRCHGLDTLAAVSLNGVELGRTDNMFIPHEFEVTGALKAGRNLLRVAFASAKLAGEERMAAYASPGTRLGWQPRSFVRKAQYHYGWDWGPVLSGCGIWQDVELIRIPAGRILDWSYVPRFAADGSCTVELTARSESVLPGAQLAFSLRREGQLVEALAPVDARGMARASLRLTQPARWWPRGMGEAALYEIELRLGLGESCWDKLTAQIGLRELVLLQEPEAAGGSFQFQVNGRPFFAKGANWIPNDSFPARVTRDSYRERLTQAAEAGMNMLRVWGGGFYERGAFYELCDTMGILVWQDFTFACARYPESQEWLDAYRAEAAEAVRRLRHHPSLALYCGNNENHQGARDWWHLREEEWGRRIYHEVLPEVCAAEDPSRPYWPSSPYGGDDPNSEESGDRHNWNVWHGAGDWRHYAEDRARFLSEFGFLAPPCPETLAGCLPPGESAADTPSLRWHNKSGKDYDIYLDLIALHYPRPRTLAELVYYGQLNQAEALKFGVEHWRRQWPRCGGALIWQLNDCWPVQSWSLVDSAGRPKASWYYARRFFAPLLLSLTHENGLLQAYLTNEADYPIAGRLEFTAWHVDGRLLWREEKTASVGGNSSAIAAEAELPAEILRIPESVVIFAAMNGGEAENILLLTEPKGFLRTDPEPEIKVEPVAEGFMLTLSAARPILGLELRLADGEAEWGDNFICLLPGRERRMAVKPKERMDVDSFRAALRWRHLCSNDGVG